MVVEKKPYLDKYYTYEHIAYLCCYTFQKYIHIYKNDIVIEPSAGNGSFINPIKSISNKNIFIDIKPEHPDILKCDFLKFEINNNNNIYVIGNPPFGFKSSLAIKFIKHSCKFCSAFGMILPKSFKKASMVSTIPLNYHLIHSFDLPNNSFYYKSMQLNIPCVFQIWEKKTYLRKNIKKIKPYMYKFVSKENADIAIRRVGSNTGNIYLNKITSKNINTHYFIKFDNKKYMYNIKKIKSNTINFVSGPKSISKNTVVQNINKQIKYLEK